MNPALYEFISLDVPPLMAVIFAALSCGLLGNFLVLRKQSLMGDAIAHAVLPGLVLAFLVTAALGHPERARDPLIMAIGAAASGIVTVLLIEVIRRYGRVESGAAMGVGFSIMFALGVLLLEQAAARHVDLDADCVLYGQLETIFWTPPAASFGDLFTFGVMQTLNRQVTTLAIVAGVVVLFVALFDKELKIASFDPGLSTALGIRASTMNYALMILVAAAAVAAFEAVGSILVIALLICPAAAARLLTDRYHRQLGLTALLAVTGSVIGYLLGARVPIWLGFDHSVNAAGAIAVTLGAILAGAIVFSPTHGVLARSILRLRSSVRIAREDLLGLLYRIEERADMSRRQPAGEGGENRWDESLGRHQTPSLGPIRAALGSRFTAHAAFFTARAQGKIERTGGSYQLTDSGRTEAKTLIRSHRLWESYLVRTLGIRPDHVHSTATKLEHLTERPTGSRLMPEFDPAILADPHDRPIPEQ